MKFIIQTLNLNIIILFADNYVTLRLPPLHHNSPEILLCLLDFCRHPFLHLRWRQVNEQFHCTQV